MQALQDHIYVAVSTNEDVHALTCKENIILFIKCTTCMHAHLQTHDIPINTAQKPQWLGHGIVDVLMVSTMVHVTYSPNFTWHFHEGARSLNTWHQDRPSADSSDVLSCGARTSSGLQTAEVCLPQHSVDIVVGDTAAAVAMETMLQRAGRVFRLWAGRALCEAVALGMRAWAGPEQ